MDELARAIERDRPARSVGPRPALSPAEVSSPPPPAVGAPGATGRPGSPLRASVGQRHRRVVGLARPRSRSHNLYHSAAGRGQVPPAVRAAVHGQVDRSSRHDGCVKGISPCAIRLRHPPSSSAHDNPCTLFATRAQRPSGVGCADPANGSPRCWPLRPRVGPAPALAALLCERGLRQSPIDITGARRFGPRRCSSSTTQCGARSGQRRPHGEGAPAHRRAGQLAAHRGAPIRCREFHFTAQAATASRAKIFRWACTSHKSLAGQLVSLVLLRQKARQNAALARFVAADARGGRVAGQGRVVADRPGWHHPVTARLPVRRSSTGPPLHRGRALDRDEATAGASAAITRTGATLSRRMRGLRSR